jgi:hypothetical protein
MWKIKLQRALLSNLLLLPSVYARGSDRECKRLFEAEAFRMHPLSSIRSLFADLIKQIIEAIDPFLVCMHSIQQSRSMMGKKPQQIGPFFASRQSHTLLCRRLATPGVNQVLVEATPRI